MISKTFVAGVVVGILIVAAVAATTLRAGSQRNSRFNQKNQRNTIHRQAFKSRSQRVVTRARIEAVGAVVKARVAN